MNRQGLNYYTYGNALKLIKSKKYFCKIPRIYIYSDKEKELYGIPTDIINDEINKTSFMDLVDSYKSIYDLAFIAYEDNNIAIEDDNDILDIIKTAQEAIDILQNSPNSHMVEDYEDLIMALTVLINRIKDTNGDYLAYLEEKNDKVKQYEEDSFGMFNKIKGSSNNSMGIRADVTDVHSNRPTGSQKHRAIDGVDFRKISL